MASTRWHILFIFYYGIITISFVVIAASDWETEEVFDRNKYDDSELQTYKETICENSSERLECPATTNLVILEALYGHFKNIRSALPLNNANKESTNRRRKTPKRNVCQIAPKEETIGREFCDNVAQNVTQDIRKLCNKSCTVSSAPFKVVTSQCPWAHFLQIAFKCVPSKAIKTEIIADSYIELGCEGRDEKLLILKAVLTNSQLLEDKLCPHEVVTHNFENKCNGHETCVVMPPKPSNGCKKMSMSFVHACVPSVLFKEFRGYKEPPQILPLIPTIAPRYQEDVDRDNKYTIKNDDLSIEKKTAERQTIYHEKLLRFILSFLGIIIFIIVVCLMIYVFRRHCNHQRQASHQLGELQKNRYGKQTAKSDAYPDIDSEPLKYPNLLPPPTSFPICGPDLLPASELPPYKQSSCQSYNMTGGDILPPPQPLPSSIPSNFYDFTPYTSPAISDCNGPHNVMGISQGQNYSHNSSSFYCPMSHPSHQSHQPTCPLSNRPPINVAGMSAICTTSTFCPGTSSTLQSKGSGSGSGCGCQTASAIMSACPTGALGSTHHSTASSSSPKIPFGNPQSSGYPGLLIKEDYPSCMYNSRPSHEPNWYAPQR